MFFFLGEDRIENARRNEENRFIKSRVIRLNDEGVKMNWRSSLQE
jgi:hypothetical protein